VLQPVLGAGVHAGDFPAAVQTLRAGAPHPGVEGGFAEFQPEFVKGFLLDLGIAPVKVLCSAILYP
jgi:hypothetical protein